MIYVTYLHSAEQVRLQQLSQKLGKHSRTLNFETHHKCEASLIVAYVTSIHQTNSTTSPV